MTKFSEEESVEVEIREDFDIIRARARARVFAKALGFGIVDQTRIATAVSEIARNALTHGRGGKAIIRASKDRKGLEIEIVDEGPGIPDAERVMERGYPSKPGGLGLGLAGAKRLMDEFHIDSKPGVGTKVTMRKRLPSKIRR